MQRVSNTAEICVDVGIAIIIHLSMGSFKLLACENLLRFSLNIMKNNPNTCHTHMHTCT